MEIKVGILTATMSDINAQVALQAIAYVSNHTMLPTNHSLVGFVHATDLTAGTGIAALSKAVEDGVVAVIGPVNSFVAYTIQPFAAVSRTPLIDIGSLSAGLVNLPFFLRLTASHRQQFLMMAAMCQSVNLSSVGLIHDSYWTDGSIWEQVMEASNLKVMLAMGVNTSADTHTIAATLQAMDVTISSARPKIKPFSLDCCTLGGIANI